MTFDVVKKQVVKYRRTLAVQKKGSGKIAYPTDEVMLGFEHSSPMKKATSHLIKNRTDVFFH